MATIADRLAEQLNEKDAELREAREKVDELEREIESMEGGWSLPDRDAKDVPELPLPRLEYRWFRMYDWQTDWSEYHVVYQLVMRHLCNTITAIPIGHTTVRGYRADGRQPWKPYVGEGRVSPPFRDGAHGHHDAAHLGLPLYAVPPDEPPVRLDGDETYARMMDGGREHRRGASDRLDTAAERETR